MIRTNFLGRGLLRETKSPELLKVTENPDLNKNSLLAVTLNYNYF